MATRSQPKFKIILAGWAEAKRLGAIVGQVGQVRGKCPVHDALDRLLVGGMAFDARELSTTHTQDLFADDSRINTEELQARHFGRIRRLNKSKLWDSYVAIRTARILAARSLADDLRSCSCTELECVC